MFPFRALTLLAAFFSAGKSRDLTYESRNDSRCQFPPVSVQPWLTLPPTPSIPGLRKQGYVAVDDGVNIWYGLAGNPKSTSIPLLFLHGGFANSNYLGNQIACLGTGYSTISIDSRGQGRSYDGEGPLDYDRMTKDVIQVLDHLKVPKVNVVGWSDGAIIGFDLAMNYSSRVHQIFAFGGSYSPGNANTTAGEQPVVEEYFTRITEEYATLSPTPEHFPVVLDKVNTMFATLPQWDAASFARIPKSGPKIVVADGKEEEVVTRDTPYTLHDWIKPSKLILLEDVSHFAFIQNPSQFNNAILKFLAAQA
ncbi:Alpha/Beta hydrolase protein [Flagelloscypha sp. PMI_526]|nr:Alpha/Beta hydrolase protein [Flagelloscypha sp. PMI_526]